MSDIRFNQWLHNSGTGGVSQVDGGHVGIGTTNPLIPVGAGNTSILNVGVVTATSYYGNGVFGDVNIGASASNTTIHSSGLFNGATPKLEVKLGGASNSYTRLINITNPGGQTGSESLGRVGIKLSLGSEASSGESNKSGAIYAESTSAYNNSTALCFGTNNTERLRIDSSGRMALGTTTLGDVNSDNLTIADSSNCGITIRSGSDFRGHIFFTDQTTTQYQGFIRYIHQANEDSLSFGTATLERMRITSDGKILIGSTNASNNARLGNELCIVGTEAYTGMSITNYPGTNASHSPMIDFNRSRGSADQNMTTVVAGDKLGEMIFRGSDGSSFQDAVTLRSYADSVSGSTVNGRFEIGTTNGSHSAKMIISKEGYVTKPNNPAFIAGRTGGNQTFTVGTYPLNVARLNVGNHYNTSTYKFVVPVAGVYYFYGQVYYNNGNGQYRLHIRKTPNGGSAFQLNTSSHKTQNGNDTSDSLSIIESMAVGDTVELYSDQNHSIQCYYNINDTTYGAHTYFMGYLIG